MATHYDVLGVRSSATPAEVRRAYRERARRLHPDALAGRPVPEVEAARRAMQDLNEAWRILREPDTRAAYDRSLRPAADPDAVEPAASADVDDIGWDEPFPRRPAEPGDLAVVLVRAIPWLAVLIVLGAIFFFTAYAKDDERDADVVGRCVVIDDQGPDPVPCTQPNDGRVLSIVDDDGACASGTTARAGDGGDWYCVRP